MIIISLFSLCLLLIITFCFKFKLSIMNIKGKKEVNEDFIPVVYLNGSNLEYIEIDIDKKYEYLISLIKKALNEDSLLLIEIQNTFSYIFTGKPRGYSFCLPYDYSAAFVDSADYPMIYSQEEYDAEINQVRTLG